MSTASERFKMVVSERYTILRELGSGGMATVHLARDIKHDREVALKVLHPDLSAVTRNERFLAEIRIAARLQHPYILGLLDSGEADGQFYYVMPVARGESLRARLEREKQLPVDDAIAIVRQVAGALDYAHQQGVLHRDVKPENILFHEGAATLTDFGLALATEHTASEDRLTESGVSLGTPMYMSPEQATSTKRLDARADVYSLGAVMYEMLAGEPPLTARTMQGLVAKLMTETPTRLRVVRPSVPAAVDEAVAKALEKVAADRFPSAGAFAAALEMGEPEDAPMRGIAAGASRSRTPRQRTVRRLLLGVGAAAVLGVGVLTAVLWRKQAPRADHVVLRDRRQITTDGGVQHPAISGDGAQVAYAVRACDPKGCHFQIRVHDVGGESSRVLLDSLTRVDRLSWSPDRRNLLYSGTWRGKYGVYLLPLVAPVPRLVSPRSASFFGAGDSLVWLPRPFSGIPEPDTWVAFGGIDGSAVDSLRVPGDITELLAVPSSRFFVAGLLRRRSGLFDSVLWKVIARDGRVTDSIVTQRALPRVSHDALWLQEVFTILDHAPIVRYAIHSSGALETRGDTVYAGPADSYTVSADGTHFVVAEGSTTYAAYSTTLAKALAGKFSEDAPLFRETAHGYVQMSPDGKTMLVGHPTRGGVAYQTVRIGAGTAVPLPGMGPLLRARMIDSGTVEVIARSRGNVVASLLDLATGTARERFILPDTEAVSTNYLPRHGWGWLRGGRSPALVLANGRSTAVSAGSEPGLAAVAWWFDPGSNRVATQSIGGEVTSFSFRVTDLGTGKGETWFTGRGTWANATWLADGSLLITVGDDFPNANVDVYSLTGPKAVRYLGRVPGPVDSFDVGADGRVALVGTSAYRGDAWLSKIQRDD